MRVVRAFVTLAFWFVCGAGANARVQRASNVVPPRMRIVACVIPVVTLTIGLAGVISTVFHLARRRPQLSTDTGLLPDLPETDL